MNNQVPQGLDPTAFYLTKSIRQAETSGSQDAYTAPGASGEYGAYQYTPDTWATDSQKYLGQSVPLTQATPAQQNQVAYSKVADLLSQTNPATGKKYTQSEVASIWNSGKPDATGNIGTNKEGVGYNTPKYVAAVKNIYQQYASGSSNPTVPPNPSSATGNTGTPPTTAQTSTQPTSSPLPPAELAVQPNTDKLLGSQTLGDFAIGGARGLYSGIDNAIQGGNWLMNQTGGRLGNYLLGKGNIPTTNNDNVAEDLSGGRQNLNSLETPTNTAQKVGSVVLPAIASMGTGFMGGAASDAVNAAKTGEAFAAPEVQQVISDYADQAGVDIKDLGPGEISKALDNAIKGASNSAMKQVYSEGLDDFLQSISKAKKVVQGTAQAAKPGLMKGVKNAAEWAAILGTTGYAGYKSLIGLYNKASGNTNSKTYGVAP